MGKLNFKHLRYFWAVAKSGSITRAAEQLHLTPHSISSQLRELEEALGLTLFQRIGRGLELSEAGRRILVYADNIFNLGDELLAVAHDQSRQKARPLAIGIADSVPKLIAHRVVSPSLDLAEPIRLNCREGRLTVLLAELAVHHLDLVIADRVMPANLNVRGYSHLLGESDITVFAAPRILSQLSTNFPDNLHAAPFLLPGEDVAVRVRLEQWFESRKLRPKIIGEFDDSALLNAFGQAGAGLFIAPTAIADYVCQQYGVHSLGRIPEVCEQFYAITTERRLTHPAIVAISQAARNELFGGLLNSPSAPLKKSRARKRQTHQNEQAKLPD